MNIEKYQRLFEACTASPRQSEMDEIITIVHEDFPAESSPSEAAGRSAEEIALEIYPVKNEKRMWGGREIIVDENSNHRTHFKKGLEYASSLQLDKPVSKESILNVIKKYTDFITDKNVAIDDFKFDDLANDLMELMQLGKREGVTNEEILKVIHDINFVGAEEYAIQEIRKLLQYTPTENKAVGMEWVKVEIEKEKQNYITLHDAAKSYDEKAQHWGRIRGIEFVETLIFETSPIPSSTDAGMKNKCGCTDGEQCNGDCLKNIIGKIDPKDWQEDFTHENGNYQNSCHQCKSLFFGHKRRIECKQCASDAGMFTREQMERAIDMAKEKFDDYSEYPMKISELYSKEEIIQSLSPAPVSEGEGEEVVNKYWFDGMIPRKKVLDMLQENMDAGLTDKDNEREPRDLLKETYGDLIEIIKTF